MISRIEGRVIEKGLTTITVDVGGVGYEIAITGDTFSKVREGETYAFSVYLAVRETSMELFGFLSREELDFFKMVISVSGIGPKTGLQIVGLAPISTLQRAIASNDLAYLTKVSGIGKKTAEKLVVELRDKLAALKDEGGMRKEESDALEALTSLGYRQEEAREALQAVGETITGTNARIKEALKILSKV